MVQLKDRPTAGKLLAKQLEYHVDDPNLLVLALPRGGVPVAFEVAQALHAPLDVFLVRKLGVPGREELAMGAIASGGEIVINEDVVRHLQISHHTIEKAAAKERLEILRRESLYRQGKGPLDVRGKTIVLVDDGLATGSTMLAAIQSLRKQNAAKIITAIPVAPESTCERLRPLTDELICLYTPEPFFGVGQWYWDFTQTTDQEVVELLRDARDWDHKPSAFSPDSLQFL